MKIIAFGKHKGSIYESINQEFQKRLSNKIKIIELPHITASSSNEVKILEEKEILKKVDSKDYNIFLDSRGKMFSSEEFSVKISNRKNISFYIGGSYGLTDKVLEKADLVISLGKMTMPHMLARAILLEQIYRADMIKKNHPYHK